MIYVEVFYKGEEEKDGIQEVRISYPREKDFMSGMVDWTVTPRNGHLTFNRGVLDNKVGFLPALLQIEGNVLGRRTIFEYPLPSCLITKRFDNADLAEGA